jgi:hypothetical protein
MSDTTVPDPVPVDPTPEPDAASPTPLRDPTAFANSWVQVHGLTSGGTNPEGNPRRATLSTGAAGVLVDLDYFDGNPDCETPHSMTVFLPDEVVAALRG